MGNKIIYESGFRRLTVANYGKKRSLLYPISIYHLSLMGYHPDRSLEEIVLFEKMLVFYRSNRLRPFYYQQDRLVKELHIKRDRIEKARSSLKKAGILIETNSGHGKKIKYSINKEKVIAALPFIYNLPEPVKVKEYFIKELTSFFEYYLTAKYLHDKIDPTLPDEAYSGNFSIVGKDKRDSNNDTGDG